jgi:hypothetical protein
MIGHANPRNTIIYGSAKQLVSRVGQFHLKSLTRRVHHITHVFIIHYCSRPPALFREQLILAITAASLFTVWRYSIMTCIVAVTC